MPRPWWWTVYDVNNNPLQQRLLLESTTPTQQQSQASKPIMAGYSRESIFFSNNNNIPVSAVPEPREEQPSAAEQPFKARALLFVASVCLVLSVEYGFVDW